MLAASTNDPPPSQTARAATPPPSRYAIDDDLIVNFPHQDPAPRRPVRFSARSLLALYAEPATTDEERAARGYSRQEAEGQRRRLRRDVSRLARRLAATPVSLAPEEELYHCVGNEAFLSRDVFRSTREHKVRHARVVLEAQARQRAAGVRDEEELARLAQASSKPARERAHDIAAGYWRVLK